MSSAIGEVAVAADEKGRSVGRRAEDFERAAAARLVRRMKLNPRENWYRDIALLVGLGIMAWSIVLAVHAQKRADTADRRAETAIVRVQHGRETALAVSCAVMSAISSAGQHVISGAVGGPDTPFTKALERLGYPPHRVRARQAQQTAALYAQSITQRVERTLEARGVRPLKGLVRSDGTIDCRAMASIADVRFTPR